MSTKVDEVKENGEANLLSLPNKILIKIFQQSTQDIRDVITLNKVCKKISEVIQTSSLFTNVKIVNNECVNDAVELIKENEEVVKKLELQNLLSGHVNVILRAVRNFQLTSLKIKNITLSDNEVLLMKEIVDNCKALRSFRLVEVKAYGALNISDLWLQILRIVSSRPMEEFSFLLADTFLRFSEWNMNSFFQANSNTLKLLKLSTPQYGFKINALTECSKLKKFYLIIIMPSIISRSWSVQSQSLKQLTRLKVENLSERDEASLFSLFSKRKYVNLRKIELCGLYGSRGYSKKILEVIATNAPNLEQLIIYSHREYFLKGSLVEVILKLMDSCKALKIMGFPAMLLSDMLKIDEKLTTGNYPLQSFMTTILLPKITDRNEAENKLSRGELFFDNFSISDLENNHFVDLQMKTKM